MLLAIAPGLATGCAGVGESGKAPVTVVAVDTSGSTKGMSGEFSKAIHDAMSQTAAKRGWFWAASGDRAVLASSKWGIATQFKVNGEEGPDLQKEDLQASADKLAASSQTKRLLARQGRQGSDLLGFLRLAGSVFKRSPDSPRYFVLLSDGGINEAGIDIFSHPPRNAAERKRLIKKLETEGLFKPGALTGSAGKPVGVFLCGIGRGAYGLDGRAAGYVQDFWNALVVEAGGIVLDAQPSWGKGSLKGISAS